MFRPEVKRRPVDDADSKIQDYEEKRRLERERVRNQENISDSV